MAGEKREWTRVGGAVNVIKRGGVEVMMHHRDWVGSGIDLGGEKESEPPRTVKVARSDLDYG